LAARSAPPVFQRRKALAMIPQMWTKEKLETTTHVQVIIKGKCVSKKKKDEEEEALKKKKE
jgi:hypothetical protein